MSRKRVRGVPENEYQEPKEKVSVAINENLWRYITTKLEREGLNRKKVSVSALVELFARKLEDSDFADHFWKTEQPVSESDKKNKKHNTSLSLTKTAKKILQERANQWLASEDKESISRKPISYPVEKLIESIQSEKLLLPDFSTNFQQLTLSNQANSIDAAKEVNSEANISNLELTSPTLNPVFNTNSSTASASKLTSISGNENGLSEINFRLSKTREFSPLPTEPGIFLATFVRNQRSYKATQCFSTSNMQASWNDLLQTDEKIAKQYKECDQSTFFVWRVCSDETTRNSLMSNLQDEWNGFFKTNKLALVTQARLRQNWANLKFLF